MLLQQRDGIRCDCCGLVVREDFTYYPMDLREAIVKDNRIISLNKRSQPSFYIDFCEHCMKTIEDEIKKHYTPSKADTGRKYPNGIHCDLTGKLMKGNYTFYDGLIAKAQVSMSNKQSSCSKCNTISTGDGKPCAKCGNNVYVKVADISSDPEYIEIWICEEVYDRFKSKAAELRESKEANQWSTGTPSNQPTQTK